MRAAIITPSLAAAGSAWDGVMSFKVRYHLGWGHGSVVIQLASII
jgi:hypothetical protein